MKTILAESFCVVAAAAGVSPSSGPTQTIVAGIFCLAIGAVGVWACLAGLRTRAALRRWPTVRGRVLERGTTGYLRNRYEAVVRYAYEVGGKEFTGDRLYPKRMGPRWFAAKEDAQKRANAFVADTVEVHYNPADPAEAYLALRSAQQMRWIAAFSAVVLAVGVLVLAYAVARIWFDRWIG